MRILTSPNLFMNSPFMPFSPIPNLFLPLLLSLHTSTDLQSSEVSALLHSGSCLVGISSAAQSIVGLSESGSSSHVSGRISCLFALPGLSHSVLLIVPSLLLIFWIQTSPLRQHCLHQHSHILSLTFLASTTDQILFPSLPTFPIIPCCTGKAPWPITQQILSFSIP